jgi:PBSX family phage terminase large subunit
VINLVGASDERAQRRIQGSTLASALVDEVTLIPQGFFKMLLSRLSVPGAKLFGTTNPDSPFHWLKTDFLDNDKLDLKAWKFRLDDNPSLDDAYVNSLKAEYTGLWYKRYIEGDWVLAEGTVYDFFDEEEHTIDLPSKRARKYIVGVDYGTTNPTVFTLIGFNPDSYPNIWLEKEYYYSSKDKGRQKTDTEYAEDLAEFIHGYAVEAIYIDPSAASFRLECFRQGIDNICEADNDVLNGIRFKAQLMANGTFKVCKSCVHTIREYATYVWDTKSSLKGEDKPVKENDHCMDALRYALFTHFGKNCDGNMTPEQLDKIYKAAMGFGNELPPAFQQPYEMSGYGHY